MMSLRIAAVVCAACIAALLWAFTAPTVQHIASPTAAVLPRVRSSRVQRADTTPSALIDSALDHDPFSSSRGSAPQSTPTVETHEDIAIETPHLIGTVVDSLGGSFALCQLSGGSARLVRVGQKLGTYELRAVAQGTATFVAVDGQRLELRVAKTGS